VSTRAPALLLLAAVAALGLTGCQNGPTAAGPTTSTGVATTSTSGTTTSPAPTTTTTTATTAPSTTTGLAGAVDGHGQVIVLDPGHNGANGSHPAEINRLVPAGRGQTKACNTTGTSTNAGYTEHAFNWDVATRVQAVLTAHGYHVVLTRANDSGVGPCVNQRADIGNQAQAAAVVSIHADGSETAGAHGFHVEYSSPALNAAQGTPSVTLAERLRDAMVGAGFPISNYLGSHGLFGRADLGGLNLSDRPTALIECGNMRDSGDAATLSSVDGRQRIANAIAAAIMTYLAH
jgi:N-acetylmuramoyl-L-alanine amidase